MFQPHLPLFLSFQLHDHAEPLLPPLHGAGLGLLCVHDCEEHRVGEGAAPQGDTENLGGWQRSHLVHQFHRQLPHDDGKHGAANGHCHGKKPSGTGMECNDIITRGKISFYYSYVLLGNDHLFSFVGFCRCNSALLWKI